jgi:hypothetical protein
VRREIQTVADALCAPPACGPLLVAAILCACAGAPAPHVSSAGDVDVRTEGKDDSGTSGTSGTWFLISCPGLRTSCTQTAGLLCPHGYFVVNADGDHIATSLGGLPEAQDGQLRVRCAPSVILGGR